MLGPVVAQLQSVLIDNWTKVTSDMLHGPNHFPALAPAMYHCKPMIVDGLPTSVGSTNFDKRSFRLDDESTLNIVDPASAAARAAGFEAAPALAHGVSHAEWPASVIGTPS